MSTTTTDATAASEPGLTITVIGASGRTGRPLVEHALTAGHAVVAFVRDPDRLELAPSVPTGQLTVVTGDAYTGDGLEPAIAGADAVVSVLGQSGDAPDDLLTVAGDRIVAAMQAADVDRFITLVGAGVREEGEAVSLSGRMMGTLLKLVAREVLVDAEEHVRRIRETDLAYTVVRAPRLTGGEGTGHYRAGDIALGFEAIARADVARFILDCLEGDRFRRAMPKVGPADAAESDASTTVPVSDGDTATTQEQDA